MSLKIPQKHLEDWIAEIIGECTQSREQRRDLLKMFRSYYYTGTSDGSVAVYNRCYPHIERLGAYLFSPSDVRFHVEYDQSEGEEVEAMGRAAARKLNRIFSQKSLDLDFAAAVNGSLIDGCNLLKVEKTDDGYTGYVIRPQFFGVLREDIEDLDRQEAFVQTSYMTPSSFFRTITERPDAEAILKQIESSASEGSQEEIEQDYFHQIIVGGTQPVSTTTSSGSGMVGIVGVPTPVLDPKVAKSLIRVDELWVQDRERQDYTTLRYIKNLDLVIEGKEKRRNLTGLNDFTGKEDKYAGHHPFVKVSPNEIQGYFWGMSEIAAIYRLQDDLNEQVRSLSRLRRLRADPPRSATGFAGLNLEKYKAFNRPRGFISEENPNAKMQEHAPEIPQEFFTWLSKTQEFFDDVAGFTPVMQGQGESGVRSQQQAQLLARNSSPRMRDRALLVERQCAEWGELILLMMRARDPEVMKEFVGPGKEVEFVLDQLPLDMKAVIDSHSSSPVYTQDHMMMAFGLAKSGAIDGADLIMLTHPPHEDILIQRAKAREAAQAQMLKEHPELLSKGKGRK